MPGFRNITDLGTELDDLVDISDLESNPLVECPATGDPRLFLTSYSSSLLQHSCLRKYQLTKLNANAKPVDHLTQLTFNFGHAVGEAVVELIQGVPLEKVIWNQLLKWPSKDFFLENPKQKKSLFHMIYALELLDAALKDGFMDDYELVYMQDGRPAAEVSFKLYLPHGYIERGYIDMILRNKDTGQYCIFDNKTSSARYMNSAQYTNSMQALGYSVVLDKLDPGHLSVNYTVFYLVWLTFLERWEQFEFPKTAVQRAQWIQSKLWDVEELRRVREQYGDYGMWPLSGEACFSYGRECQWMHECHMDTLKLIQPLRQSDLDQADPPLTNQGEPWDIVMDWTELVRS